MQQPLRLTTLILATLLGTTGATCQEKPAGEDTSTGSAEVRVTLPGIDVSSLTAREHRTWSELVTELYAPCAELAVPLAGCVRDRRACAACAPAAVFLMRQVQAGSPKAQIAEVYAQRFAADKVKTIVLGASAAKGPSDAVVTVVEFADFECPACGVAYGMLEQVLAKHDGKLRMVFKHFPLAAHVNAKPAAYAAYAAQKQGQFWALHHALFEHQEQLTEPDILGYAKKLGLDLARFRTDMHSEAAVAWVAQEQKQGESLGVGATPTLFINGRECDLSKLGNPMRELEEWIALELALGPTSPAAAASSASATSPSAASAPATAAPP